VSSIKPDDGSSKINSTNKINSTPIVMGDNSLVLLELSKKALDRISSFINSLSYSHGAIRLDLKKIIIVVDWACSGSILSN
jgi:hypothetical protein